MSSEHPKKASAPLKNWRDGALSTLLETLSVEPDLADFDLKFRAKLSRYGLRIKAVRKGQNMTQGQLAKLAGLTQARISGIEAGTLTDGPSLRTMHKLADALRKPDLLDFEGASAPAFYVDPGFLRAGNAIVMNVMTKARNIHKAVVHWGPQPSTVAVMMTPDGTFDAVKMPIEKAGELFPQGHLVINGFAEAIDKNNPFESAPNDTESYLVCSDDPNGNPVTINVLRD